VLALGMITKFVPKNKKNEKEMATNSPGYIIRVLLLVSEIRELVLKNLWFLLSHKLKEPAVFLEEPTKKLQISE
jgi:hypothetical protein